MKKHSIKVNGFLLGFLLIITACSPPSLWELANENKDLLRVSTLIMAQDVPVMLGTEEGLDSAVMWCKDAGITHFFLFRFLKTPTFMPNLLKCSLMINPF